MSATTPTMLKQLRQRTKKRGNDFSRYIYAVLMSIAREQGVELQISGKGMLVMNAFVQDMYERITLEASRLAKYNNRTTLSARDIQSATRLVLPSELAKHAVFEGTKSLIKFNESLAADPLTPGARKTKAAASAIAV